jgi:hypothetical protein
MADLDYQAVFQAMPGPMLLLNREFTVLDVNNDYLDATRREKGQVVGQHVLNAVPVDEEHFPSTSGNMVSSLESVRATGETDKMDLFRYDLEIPGKPGVFEERYWAVVNAPVIGPEGQVELILLQAMDATATVRSVLKAQTTG